MALTVKLNATPATCGDVATTLKVVASAGSMVTGALVPAASGSGEPLMRVAVMDGVPEVVNVTGKGPVPATSAASGGSDAVRSLEVMCTVAVPAMETFHQASTALTVAATGLPAVDAVGVPVLPVAVPGAATSPASRTCSWVAVPAPTITFELVPAATDGDPDTQVAVTDDDPPVRRVTANVPVPPTSAPFAARTALASDEVTATVGVAEVTRFQFTSTTRAVALTEAPAVTGVGDPLLPLTVPGAADSPGRSTWSLVAAPAVSVSMAVADSAPVAAVMVSVSAVRDEVIVAVYWPVPT